MSKRQVDRNRKVTALAARAGTEGERQAAEAALDWLAAKRQRKRQRQQQRLTDALIKRLPVPAEGNKVTYDSDVPGFGARVTDWRRTVLHPQLRDQERPRAQAHHRSAPVTGAPLLPVPRPRAAAADRPGGDPSSDIEAERAAPTVVELCDRFEAEHLPRKRRARQADYRRMIEQPHPAALRQHLKVADVAFEDIDRLHRKITTAGHLYRANRVVAVLSKMFCLADALGHARRQPVQGHRAQHRAPPAALPVRRRAGAAHQGAGRSTRTSRRANIVRHVAVDRLQARRSAEHALGRRRPRRAGKWSKLPRSTKQKEQHRGPTERARAAAAERDSRAQAGKHEKPLGEYVFPSHGAAATSSRLKRAWRQLCKAAGITGLRIHDLRHSYASQLASGGASLPLIGALLGHSNPATTARYAHLLR